MLKPITTCKYISHELHIIAYSNMFSTSATCSIRFTCGRTLLTCGDMLFTCGETLFTCDDMLFILYVVTCGKREIHEFFL